MKPSFKIYNVLRPIGWLYGLVIGIRNRMYDRQRLKSASFPVPVISIGNITVGGTGKTPHTEYTVSLLKDRFRTAVLSRGYGRHTKGFFMSDNRSDSGLIGDEPFQIKSRFPDIDVAVCEDRAKGITRLIDLCSPQAIILDDAFQHRKVTPSLNILLVNWHRNILDDALLPAGRLRESAKNRKRAHIIIVTKCPDNLSTDEMARMEERLKVSPQQQIFFSTLQYGQPYLIGKPNESCTLPQTPVLALTGIASPHLMVTELKRQGHQVTLMDYPDHYRYTKKDIAHITTMLENMPPKSVIVTTAKDAARLKDLELDTELLNRIYVLPVSIRFLCNAKQFEQTITTHVESFGNTK